MMLDNIIKAIRYDIIHLDDLSGLFNEIAFGIKDELTYPALLINIADITPGRYYGYDDVTLFFTIVNKDEDNTKISTLQILDTLRQYYNNYRGTTDPTNVIRYIIEYNGGFEDTYDFDSKEYVVTTIWRVRSISTT